MGKWAILVVALVSLKILTLSWAPDSAQARTDGLPRLGGAMLLLGYPPSSLFITTGNETWKLQHGEQGDDFISPSISADGTVVASAHRIAGDPPTRIPRLVVSTYSLGNNIWTDHKELEVLTGSVSISPDGSRLACFTRNMAGTPSGLRILSLKTGKVIAAQEMPEHAGTGISWSPDGRQIAFDKESENSATEKTILPHRAIYVFDVDTGSVSKMAEGISPSWSPSGEWIAFVTVAKGIDSQYQINLTHPDGTASRVLMTFRSYVEPNLKPVWSPDTKTLLINISRNADKDTWDIYMLDIATLKLTRKFKNTSPVFAWVAAR